MDVLCCIEPVLPTEDRFGQRHKSVRGTEPVTPASRIITLVSGQRVQRWVFCWLLFTFRRLAVLPVDTFLDPTSRWNSNVPTERGTKTKSSIKLDTAE